EQLQVEARRVNANEQDRFPGSVLARKLAPSANQTAIAGGQEVFLPVHRKVESPGHAVIVLVRALGPRPPSARPGGTWSGGPREHTHTSNTASTTRDAVSALRPSFFAPDRAAH